MQRRVYPLSNIHGVSSIPSLSLRPALNLQTFQRATFKRSSLPPLSFQSLTTIKFSNPLFLTTMRNAGGCTYSPSASDVTHSRNHLPWCSAFVPSALRHACGDSSLPGLLSTLNFRLWTSASPLEATLTSHSQLIENTATLSSLDATLTRFLAVSHLESTLTKKVGGVGLRLPSSPLPVHFKSRATY